MPHLHSTRTHTTTPPCHRREQQLALPLDLVVRFGVCQLHLDRLPSALQCFAALRQRVGTHDGYACVSDGAMPPPPLWLT